MKAFVTFLLAMFVLGGPRTGRLPLSRPVALVCVVVGAGFFSLRVIE